MRSVLWVNFEISKFLNNARLPIAENQTRQSSGNKIQCMFGINFDFFFSISAIFFSPSSVYGNCIGFTRAITLADRLRIKKITESNRVEYWAWSKMQLSSKQKTANKQICKARTKTFTVPRIFMEKSQLNVDALYIFRIEPSKARNRASS